MRAMYSFFIRNYGKDCFRIGDRESYFSGYTEQKAASISSESGNFLLPFAVHTWHGAIHNVAFYTFLFSQIIAYLTMVGRFRKDPRWRGYAWYSLAAGVLALPVWLIPLPDNFSWFYVWMLAFPMTWLELVAIRLWTLSAISVKVR